MDKLNRWKPYKAVVKRADEVIYKDVNEEDESKSETATKRTKIKLKFNSLESIIKAEIGFEFSSKGYNNMVKGH